MIKRISVQSFANDLMLIYQVIGVMYDYDNILVRCQPGKINTVLKLTGLEMSEHIDQHTILYQTYLEDGTTLTIGSNVTGNRLYGRWRRGDREVVAIGEWG